MPNTGDIVRASDFEAIKPQLSIGSVTTGAAGSKASASITGTSPNFKLNLTIPRGNTGATGATGPQGPSGTYTGPLKPTSSYWRNATRLRVSGLTQYFGPPSGGTWACLYPNTIYNTDTYASVVAGGTAVGSASNSTGNADAYAYRILCWRIQ